jgi:hypothetical protein
VSVPNAACVSFKDTPIAVQFVRKCCFALPVSVLSDGTLENTLVTLHSIKIGALCKILTLDFKREVLICSLTGWVEFVS